MVWAMENAHASSPLAPPASPPGGSTGSCSPVRTAATSSERRCTACGCTKPLTEFPAPRYRADRPGRVLHFRRCRDCLRLAEARRRERAAEQALVADAALIAALAAQEK